MALLRPREIATIVVLTQPSLALCDHRLAEDLAACMLTLIRRALWCGRDGPDDPLPARVRGEGLRSLAVDTAADATRRRSPRLRVLPASRRWPCTSTGDVLATADTFSGM